MRESRSGSACSPGALIVGDGDVGTKGIVHMNTRQNIRRRVCSIEGTNHIYKYILSGKGIRS